MARRTYPHPLVVPQPAVMAYSETDDTWRAIAGGFSTGDAVAVVEVLPPRKGWPRHAHRYRIEGTTRQGVNRSAVVTRTSLKPLPGREWVWQTPEPATPRYAVLVTSPQGTGLLHRDRVASGEWHPGDDGMSEPARFATLAEAQAAARQMRERVNGGSITYQVIEFHEEEPPCSNA